jgi:hypothetical protein
VVFVAAVLYNSTLTNAFQPSQLVMLTAGRLTLDFAITVPSGPAATIRWYLEFASSPNGPWYREVAEEDSAGGVVLMPAVIRTFAANAGTNLPAGSYNFSTQFSRQEALARVQIEDTTSTSQVTISTPDGTTPSVP